MMNAFEKILAQACRQAASVERNATRKQWYLETAKKIERREIRCVEAVKEVIETQEKVR